MNFDYYGSWRNYAFPPQSVKFAREHEIKNLCHEVDFSASKNTSAGLPLITDGKKGYVIDNEDMTMVFGGTGSGKTRYVATEIICNLALRGDSMIIMDQKGSYSGGKELAPYVRYTLDKQGYKCYFLNFKDLNGDKMNILGKIWDKWHEGKFDDAGIEMDKFLNPLLKQGEGNKDPYWNQMGAALLRIIISMLCASCTREELNFISICNMLNLRDIKRLKELAELLPLDEANKAMLASMPDATNTIGCIINCASYLISDFARNSRLVDMVSHDTINITDLYTKKTALFIILPEDQTYNSLAGIMLGQISDTLIDAAYRNPDSTLPKKVNFIADEFSNYYIDKMDTRISTDRSKNIRWYLFSQGVEQMKIRYDKTVVETILANCSNIVYMSSPDSTLLKMLSEASGMRSDNLEGVTKPLISVHDLAALKKGAKTREIYYTCRGIHFVTELLDISCYTSFRNPDMDNPDFKGYKIPIRRQQKQCVYNIKSLLISLVYNCEDEYKRHVIFDRIKEYLKEELSDEDE